MAKDSVYLANKQKLIDSIKEWLKYIPSSYIEFKDGKNKLDLYYYEEKVPHTLISLEWVKRDNLDYIELLSFNDKYEPDDFTPDADDLMNFDYDEIRTIYKLAEANARQFVR